MSKKKVITHKRIERGDIKKLIDGFVLWKTEKNYKVVLSFWENKQVG